MNTNLPKWAKEFGQKWNSNSYSTFVIHGNVFDLFPYNEKLESFLSLKQFISKRLFLDKKYVMYYDVGDGLVFRDNEVKKEFFSWIEVYDQVEKTNFHIDGMPREFYKIIPIIKRFINHIEDDKDPKHNKNGIIFFIDFPEKIFPPSENGSSIEDKMSITSMLKLSLSQEVRESKITFIMLSESIQELNQEIVRNPAVCKVEIDFPVEDERNNFIGTYPDESFNNIYSLSKKSLAQKTSGLNITQIKNILSEAENNQIVIDHNYLSDIKKKLIEEYCQGLIVFKEPKENLNLDCIATHTAAKKKLKEIVWLIKNDKKDVVEKGILIPGRVGVGKSFLIDCFSSECCLPVVVLGDFRSKWVGDTEKQLSKILATIKALGPVIVVVDEADAVFGNRSSSGDSGVSTRVFASLAAHIGDSSIRGTELWIAMTSRPDLLSIDMKRQGRFGLCIPLFATQSIEETMDMFKIVTKNNKIVIKEQVEQYIIKTFNDKEMTGSEIESIVIRAKEMAVLEKHDDNITIENFQQTIESFINPLDQDILLSQDLAAYLSCTDARYLPKRYSDQKLRPDFIAKFNSLNELSNH
jgi:SpoVK/Ycf46/Vps4 family AAA+-type ATPase